jgi:hypothetical protein
MDRENSEIRLATSGTQRHSKWRVVVWASIGTFAGLFIILAALGRLPSGNLRKVYAEVRAIRLRGEAIEPKDIATVCPTSPLEATRAAEWLRLCTLAEPTGKFTDDVKPLPFLGELHVPDDALSQPGSEQLRMQARAFLEKHAEVLRLAHELASDPRPVAYQQKFEDGFNAKLPWAVSLRALHRVLALELRLRVVDGDMEGACSSWLAMISLADSLRPMPCGVSCGVVEAVRRSMLIRAIKEAPFLANQAAISDAQLVRLCDRLLDLKVEQDLKAVMLGERIMGFVAFQHPEQIFDQAPEGESIERNAARAEDCLLYLETMRDLISLCELPFAECQQRADERWREALKRIKTSAGENDRRFAGSLSLLPGAVALGIQGAAQPIAYRDTTVLAIAARRFARQRGKLPMSLDELVPQFCSSIPIDPYTGRQLLCKTSSNGFLIYSAGLNRTNDAAEDGSDDIVVELFAEGATLRFGCAVRGPRSALLFSFTL